MSDHPGKGRLPIEIRRQPDDTTCGPTCLHAVYRYFGEEVALDDLIEEVPTLAAGGTLGVALGNHALRRGYSATLYTYNLQVFDPSWFREDPPELARRLARQRDEKPDEKVRVASALYLEFLELGGGVRMRDLTPRLVRTPLERGLPLLTGISATFLYREPRETPAGRPDDVLGEPTGHFVVLSGYDSQRREVCVSDPLYPNPLAKTHTYPVAIERVISAILLGVLTFDANLLVLEPRESRP